MIATDETDSGRIRPIQGADPAGLCLFVPEVPAGQGAHHAGVPGAGRLLRGNHDRRGLPVVWRSPWWSAFCCRSSSTTSPTGSSPRRALWCSPIMRMELGAHLRRMPMGYFTEGNIGKISSVLSSDMVFIEENCMTVLADMMSYIFAQAILVHLPALL